MPIRIGSGCASYPLCKRIVRSKSFHVRVKPKRKLPKIPVQTSGRVTSRNVVSPFAPRSRAASSTWRSYRFQTASMTRNENGIPQITFAPRAVYHRFGVYPMNFQRSWLPRLTRNAGVIRASIRMKKAITSPFSRQWRRKAMESMKPKIATSVPATRDR